MNYLAHIRLAGNNPESIIGNFLGDFVKGRLTEDDYTPGIRRGILMHRSIDAWTDSHETTRKCSRLISPERRRWSRVLVDIFYDHFLAVNWSTYSHETLRDCLDRTYGIILGAVDIFPEPMAQRISTIIEGGWIERYQNISGLGVVFEGMSRRVKRKNPLCGSERELVENYDEINEHFNQFFPEIIEYAKRFEKTHGSQML